MVKPIIHDILFLSQKSEPATVLDAQVIRDLQDTPEGQRGPLCGYGGQYDRSQQVHSGVHGRTHDADYGRSQDP